MPRGLGVHAGPAGRGQWRHSGGRPSHCATSAHTPAVSHAHGPAAAIHIEDTQESASKDMVENNEKRTYPLGGIGSGDLSDLLGVCCGGVFALLVCGDDACECV